MILVSVGTQKQQFTRLFEMIEKSNKLNGKEIIAQAGYTKYQSEKMKIFDFIDNCKMEELINDAEFVICHAGVGTIFEALLKGKKVIACPRYKKYKEHVNDHQLEICEALEKEGYILTCYDTDNLDEKIDEVSKKILKKYQKDESYLDVLRKEI